MGAIVIRTRYDEGTESAEVATSANTGLLVELDSVMMHSNLVRMAPKVPRVPKYKKRHIVLIKSRTGTRM